MPHCVTLLPLYNYFDHDSFALGVLGSTTGGGRYFGSSNPAYEK